MNNAVCNCAQSGEVLADQALLAARESVGQVGAIIGPYKKAQKRLMDLGMSWEGSGEIFSDLRDEIHAMYMEALK